MSSPARKPFEVVAPGVTIRHLGEGSLGELFRSKDWSRTPLGPSEQWPQTLKGYAAMVLGLQTPAIIFWGDELVQLYNDGYAAIMGPRHPKYLGERYRDCWPDTYPTIFPWMQRVLAGEVVDVERSLIPVTRHGFVEEAYFTFTFSPLRDDAGKIAGILQLVTEVTAEVLQDRREQMLHSLLSAGTAGGAENRRSLVDALGRNPDDAPFAAVFLARGLGKDKTLLFEGSAPAGPAASELEVESALGPLAGRVFDRDEAEELDLSSVLGAPLLSTRGEPVVRGVAIPIRRDGERPRGVLVLGLSPRLRFDDAYRGFTWRLSREVASVLSASEELALVEQLKLVLDSAKMGTWHFDLRSGRIHVSPRTASFLGYDHAVESDFDEINQNRVHPDDQAQVEQAWRTAIERRELYSAEYRIIRLDGEIRWLQSFGRAVYAPDGRPLSLSGVSLDVTERRRSEEEQARARERAERLATDLSATVRARDEFLSIASHELKTPISSVKLYTQGLERAMARSDPRAFTTEKVKEVVGKTGRQIQRLARLVDDMLDVSRINAGKLALSRRPVELEKLVRDTVEGFRPQFEAQGATVEVKSTAPVRVEVDDFRIEQVLVNLLTNALRYGAGKPAEVSLSVQGGAAVVRVSDRGIGIAEADQARIFERFERAISPNEVSGLGVGLYISKQIVEQHGGRLYLERSRPGEGSTFAVEFPL